MTFGGKIAATVAQDAASFEKCLYMANRFLIYFGIRGNGRE